MAKMIKVSKALENKTEKRYLIVNNYEIRYQNNTSHGYFEKNNPSIEIINKL